MKHIRPYDKLEELSEYLQEFFDMFNIKQYHYIRYTESPYDYWNILDTENISITLLEEDEGRLTMMQDILYDILNTISRRLGQKVYMNTYGPKSFTINI